MTGSSVTTIQLLLVEDNPGDVLLIRQAVSRWKTPASVRVIVDGEAALSYLRAETPSTPRPDLVILDLKLPRRDGGEVLREIGPQGAARPFPVVVFTSSRADIETLRDSGHAPDLYLVKPIRLDEYLATVASIESWWLE